MHAVSEGHFDFAGESRVEQSCSSCCSGRFPIVGRRRACCVVVVVGMSKLLLVCMVLDIVVIVLVVVT